MSGLRFVNKLAGASSRTTQPIRMGRTRKLNDFMCRMSSPTAQHNLTTQGFFSFEERIEYVEVAGIYSSRIATSKGVCDL